MPAVPFISCVPRDMELGFSRPQFPSLTGILIPALPTSQDCGEDAMRQSRSQQSMSQGPDKHFFFFKIENKPGLAEAWPHSTVDRLSPAAFAQ